MAARLSMDAADVKSVVAEKISIILLNTISLLTSFIVGFIVEWRVALLILGTFPLLVLAKFAQMCSNVVQPGSFVGVFETLLSSTATTVDVDAGKARADFYVTCILSSLPWGGAVLVEDLLATSIQSYTRMFIWVWNLLQQHQTCLAGSQSSSLLEHQFIYLWDHQ